jgi:hypothetical protein
MVTHYQPYKKVAISYRSDFVDGQDNVNKDALTKEVFQLGNDDFLMDFQMFLHQRIEHFSA